MPSVSFPEADEPSIDSRVGNDDRYMEEMKTDPLQGPVALKKTVRIPRIANDSATAHTTSTHGSWLWPLLFNPKESVHFVATWSSVFSPLYLRLVFPHLLLRTSLR